MMLSQRKAGAKYCSGCNRELDPYEAIKWTVCIECTRAGHKGRSRMREETAVAGLKTLRNSKDKKPRYHCDNCGCDRFKPCQCSKKKVGKDGKDT